MHKRCQLPLVLLVLVACNEKHVVGDAGVPSVDGAGAAGRGGGINSAGAGIGNRGGTSENGGRVGGTGGLITGTAGGDIGRSGSAEGTGGASGNIASGGIALSGSGPGATGFGGAGIGGEVSPGGTGGANVGSIGTGGTGVETGGVVGTGGLPAASGGFGGTSTGGVSSGGTALTGGQATGGGATGGTATGGTTTGGVSTGGALTGGTGTTAGTGGSPVNGGAGGTAGSTNPCCTAFAAGSSGSPIQLSGCNLESWNVTLGDAVAGSVTEADILRESFDTPEEGCFTRLTANVYARIDVMAHIIAYMPQTLSHACSHNQEVIYSFRVPDANSRGETVEGGMFSYGGLPDHLDHGMAWQWIVNEQNTSAFQRLQLWSTEGNPDGFWTDSGTTIGLDQQWHTVQLQHNFEACTATLIIDGGQSLIVPLAHEYKSDFGADTTARVQVEAVSRWPGVDSTGGGRHRIDVKDWSWTLTPR